MDERHWWLATRVNDTLFNSRENLSDLESIFLESTNVQMINAFLNEADSNRYVYFVKSIKYPERDVTVSVDIKQLQSRGQFKGDRVVILLVLRSDRIDKVSLSNFESELFCVELKDKNILSNLSSLIGQGLMPLLLQQYSSKLPVNSGGESHGKTLSSNMSGQLLNLWGQLKQQTETISLQNTSDEPIKATLDSNFDLVDQIKVYESFIEEVVKEIDLILLEVNERGSERDIFLAAEAEKWSRRYILLQNLTAQLKYKQFKNAIGFLVSKKSKLIKKWRVIETSITEALNMARDKMKYLDSFKTELELLERPNLDPLNLIYILPRIMRKMKQMESASRHFARQGYTGSLLAIIRRQVLNIMDNRIAVLTKHSDSSDKIFAKILDEYSNENLMKFFIKTNSEIKSDLPKEESISMEDFNTNFGELKVLSCTILGSVRLVLLLYEIFGELVSTLREAINLSITTLTAQSNLSVPGPASTKLSIVSRQADYFVSIHDNQSILGNWLVLNDELLKFKEIILAGMIIQSETNQKIASQLLVNSTDISNQLQRLEINRRRYHFGGGSSTTHSTHEHLDRLEEEADETISDALSDDDIFDSSSASSLSNSKFMLEWLLDLCGKSQGGVDLQAILLEFKHKIFDNLSENFQSSELLRFYRSNHEESMNILQSYKSFEQDMELFDKIMLTFLKFIFMKKVKTEEVISVLAKLDNLKFRKAINGMIAHKFSESFLHFRNDISNIAQSFQQFKKEPSQTIGVPPIVNAVNWSNKMLSQLELPMLRFQDNKAIREMREYEPTVRQYNRLSKKLVEFNSAYVNYWLSSIEHCVAKFKSPLLTIHPVQLQVTVNIPENILGLIDETRFMVRTNSAYQANQSVVELLKSEKRIKLFHCKLNDAIAYFNRVKSLVADDSLDQLTNHFRLVLQTFQPGSTTLSWSSVNIDVFLHKVIQSIQELEMTITEVNSLDKFIRQIIQMIERRKAVHYEKITCQAWNHQIFTQKVKEYIAITKTDLSGIMTQCQAKINEIHQQIFPESQRKLQPCLFEMESQLKSQINERYNVQMRGSMIKSIVYNMIYIAKCSDCSLDMILNFLADSGFEDFFDHSSTTNQIDRETCETWNRDVFCRNDMEFIYRMEETVEHEDPLIKFIVYIKYEIPQIKFEPKLIDIQASIGQMTRDVLELFNDLMDFNGDKVDLEICSEMGPLQDLALNIVGNFENYESKLLDATSNLMEFEFLWRMNTEQLTVDNLSQSNHYELVKDKIRHILRLKSYLKELPREINIQSVILSTTIFKEVLLSLLNNWQNNHGQKLHEKAKMLLEEVTGYRENVSMELNQQIEDLEQLNEILSILDKIFDLDLKIDSIYQPIEAMYDDLEHFELAIPREEAAELENLRRYWSELMAQAEDQRQLLLKEKKNEFHQELDKQVKKFTVEIIKFRNLFDYETPGMSKSDPIEVEAKLGQFQSQYSIYEAKRHILVKISSLFGLRIQSFHELDSMKEDLSLLSQLYSLYQKFSKFNKQFTSTLWNSVDLELIFIKLTEFWDECLALPSKLKEKDSYIQLKMQIDKLIKLHSILSDLAAKEIRNRHWLRVMQACGVTFQLESSSFFCGNLIEINLLEHKEEISNICFDARKEMELEVKLHQIEEEWTEQVLVLVSVGPRKLLLLDESYTSWLLEQLSHSQGILDGMFGSEPRHIEALKDEASLWAGKLLEIGEVLELWLEVQRLWYNLESVFKRPAIIKDFAAEAKRFDRLDRSYVKSMKRVYETKNVFQCCISNEYSKKNFLKNIKQGLDNCFEGIQEFLHKQRELFNRLWFVPDSTILSILNSQIQDGSLKKYLPLLFTAVSDFIYSENSKSKQLEIVGVSSATNDQLQLTNPVAIKEDVVHTLCQLTNEIRASLIDRTNQSIDYLNKGDNIEELVKYLPSQLCVCVLHTYWTNEIAATLPDLKNDKKAIVSLAKKFNIQMTKISVVLNKAAWKSQDDSLSFTVTHRVRLRALTLAALYLRDSLVNLSTKKLKEGDDFEYVKLIKMQTVSVSTPSLESTVSKFQLNVLNTPLELGYEFYGNLPTVAWTPTTDKAISTILLASQQNLAVALFAGSCYGKSVLLSDVARQRHEYLATLDCHSNMTHNALVNFFCGLAVNGCWGNIDNNHLLNERQATLIYSMIDQLISSLRMKSESITFLDRYEVGLLPSAKIAMTATIDISNTGDKLIPSNLKQIFRPVGLSQPDYSQVIKWYCCALNYRSARVLSMRLSTILTDGNDIIDDNGTKLLTLNSILIAINKAAEIKFNSSSTNASNKEKSTMSEQGVSTSLASLQEFWPSYTEKRAKSPQASFIKQKTIIEPPVAISPAAKFEHSLVVEALTEILLPKMNAKNERLFKDLLKNSFQTYSELHSRTLIESLPTELVAALQKECKLRKYPVNNSVMEKYAQLYFVASNNQMVILSGNTFTGKSSSLSVLLSALNSCNELHNSTNQNQPRETTSLSNELTALSTLLTNSNQNQQSQDNNIYEALQSNPIQTQLTHQSHRCYSIYHSGLENQSELFAVTKSESIDEGLFTSYWRKANRNDLTTWITFDGEISSNWADNLNRIVDSYPSGISLPNGEFINQIRPVRLIFEVESSSQLTPGLISRAGLVHFPDNLIGWQDIKLKYLDNKRFIEIVALNKILDKVMDPIIQYISTNHKDISQNIITASFQTSLKLLSQILLDNPEITNEIHMQRLFVFVFIWSLDSSICGLSKQAITNLLKKETQILPDDDSSINIFDYYIDESGEWDLWSSKLPPMALGEGGSDDFDSSLIGENLVETVSTLRCRMLLDIALRGGLHPLLIGSSGSGKSLVLDTHWRKTDMTNTNVVRFVCSRATKTQQLMSFIESNIEHRHGLVYSGKDNRRLVLVIEDLNVQLHHTNELLRQLVDISTVQNNHSPYTQIKITEFNVIGSCTTNYDADRFSLVHSKLSRLLRHFVIIKLKQPIKEELSQVIQSIFEFAGGHSNRPLIPLDDYQRLQKASQLLYEDCNATIYNSSALYGRYHLKFTLKSLRDLSRGFDNLHSESSIYEYWAYLARRVFEDSLVLDIDIKWFNDKLLEIINLVWTPEVASNTSRIFSTILAFQSSARSANPPSNSNQDPLPAQAISENLADMRKLIKEQIHQYNTFELGANNQPINAFLSDNYIQLLLQIQRQIEQPVNGHAIVVGSIGCHLSQVSRLALYISQIPVQPLDTATDTGFIDTMKMLLRTVGSEGRKAAVVLTARDLHSSFVLDSINSIMISADCPSLFPPDELAGLLSAIAIGLRREKSSSVLSNLDLLELFRSRIRRNLHIILCLPPNNQIILKESIHNYPGILGNARVIWVKDSTEEYMKEDALYYLNEHLEEINSYITDSEQINKESIALFITRLYGEVCKIGGSASHPIIGQLGPGKFMKIGKIAMNDKKKEIYKYENAQHAPYAQSFLREKLKQLNSPEQQSADVIDYGPYSFHRFLYILRRLMQVKSIERIQSTNSMTRAIYSIGQTRLDIEMIGRLIHSKQSDYDELTNRSKELLKMLIDKITMETIIQAKQQDSGYLDDLLSKSSQNQQSENSMENDPLLTETERDELDAEFEKIREENLKNRKSILKDLLEKTRREYQALKVDMAYSIEQVNYWKNKIDRPVIDRIKTYPNPPSLVIDVIEMIFVLIGKHISPIRRDTQSNSTTDADENSDEKHRWKKMIQFMNDPAKFVDILHNVSWTDGLDKETYLGVKSYLSTAKDPQMGITGEGTLLSQAENVNIRAKKARAGTTAGSDTTYLTAQQNQQTALQPVVTTQEGDEGGASASGSGGGGGGHSISVSATKYASEDAAVLVQYAVALVEYTERCGPVKQALQKIHELEIEMEDNDGKEESSEEINSLDNVDYSKLEIDQSQIDQLELECDSLKQQFNDLIGQRSKVESELKALKDRLDLCKWLVQNIGKMEQTWIVSAENYKNHLLILFKCIISAAYLAYCGPLSFDGRAEFLGKATELFKSSNLLQGNEQWSSQLTFNRCDIIHFLASDIEMSRNCAIDFSAELEDELDNSCFLLNSEILLRNWCLISDPNRRVVSWLCRLYSIDYKGNNSDTNFSNIGSLAEINKSTCVTIISHLELHSSKLEGCLSSGMILIVTDCDVEKLAQDESIRQLLRQQHRFIEETQPFKLKLTQTQNEIECSPSFRLFLHTSRPPANIPHTLLASTFLISFNCSHSILHNEFLNRFIIKAKPSIDSERKYIMKEKEKLQRKLYKVEQQILDDLSNDIRLVKNNDHCLKITRYLKLYDEIDANIQQKQYLYQANKKSVDNYSDIANRFSICFEMANKVKNIQQDYKVDFDKYSILFDSLIESSERLSNKSILEKVTKQTTQYALLSMNSDNKFVFCFLLATEIEKSMDHLEPSMEEYFFSPISIAVKNNSDFIKQSESKSSNTKKPFDWMTEEQLLNVKVITTSLKYFRDLLDNMYKDSRDYQWRILFESEAPETTNIVEKLFKFNINNYQKLCLLRTFRSERIHQISMWFIQAVLNLKFKAYLTPSDIKLVINSAPENSAILIKYDTDTDTVTSLLSQTQLAQNSLVYQLKLCDQSKESIRRFSSQLQSNLQQTKHDYDKLSSSNNQTGKSNPSQRQNSATASITGNKNIYATAFIVIHLTNSNQLAIIQRRVGTIYDNTFRSSHFNSSTGKLTAAPADSGNLMVRIVFTLAESPQAQQITNNPLVNQTHLVLVNLHYPMNIRDSVLFAMRSSLHTLAQNNSYSRQQPINVDLPVLLHNIAMLLAIIRQRTTITQKYIGPMAFDLGEQILEQTTPVVIINELIPHILSMWFNSRNNNWAILRYFLTFNVITSCIPNEYDRNTVKSLVDLWIQSSSLRKEFEFPKLKYRTPAVLFNVNLIKPSELKKAFQQISPFLFSGAESCHLNISAMSRSNNDKELIDRLQLTRYAFEGQNPKSQLIDLNRVENELFELTRLLFNKLPKNSVETILEKNKRIPSPASHFSLLIKELYVYQNIFSEVSQFILKVRKVLMNETSSFLTQKDYDSIWSVLNNQVPQDWLNLLPRSTTEGNRNDLSVPVVDWLGNLLTKYSHLEKLSGLGRDKIICYNIGSFHYPETLFGLFRQEALQQFMKTDKTGSFKSVRYNLEFINRDKDHIREAPSDGIYIHGLCLWGCGFDRSNNELTDTSIKNNFTYLPVAHLTFTTNEQDKSDQDQFICPIFLHSQSKNQSILNVNLLKDGTSPGKWILRGVFITICPN